MKKVLILGGTSFIGRVLIEELLKTNYDLDITIFNRGKTNPDIFPDINKIIGDRETKDIEKIFGTKWDIVFDISSYYPDSLQKIVENIKTDKYVYISTVSVYDTNSETALKETDNTYKCLDSQRNDKSMETYGIRKAECERVLLNSGLNKTILRPSLVYGKFDPTDRFYYWIYHIFNQSTVLLPESSLNNLINFTFVEDLAKTIIFTGFNKMNFDIYNINTHKEVHLTEIINIISNQLSKSINIKLANDEFLNNENIKLWSDIALTVPHNFYFDNSRILNEIDFEFESLDSSINKTISYYRNLNYPECKNGISIEKEKKLLSLVK